jgi:lysophospholipase L1-like esterase
MPGQVNGYNVALNWWNQGYRGCWVFALGTNDAANVSAGSNAGMMARIQEMMSVAHGEPVMWVNTVTELNAGPWAEANEQAWDTTLVQALAQYPNMRIFNWAGVAQPGWFLTDGIHYNSVGCAARARAIADALARAFPRHGHSDGQIVG